MPDRTAGCNEGNKFFILVVPRVPFPNGKVINILSFLYQVTKVLQ